MADSSVGLFAAWLRRRRIRQLRRYAKKLRRERRGIQSQFPELNVATYRMADRLDAQADALERSL